MRDDEERRVVGVESGMVSRRRKEQEISGGGNAVVRLVVGGINTPAPQYRRVHRGSRFVTIRVFVLPLSSSVTEQKPPILWVRLFDS